MSKAAEETLELSPHMEQDNHYETAEKIVFP